jgi:hypothetical protein
MEEKSLAAAGSRPASVSKICNRFVTTPEVEEIIACTPIHSTRRSLSPFSSFDPCHVDTNFSVPRPAIDNPRSIRSAACSWLSLVLSRDSFADSAHQSSQAASRIRESAGCDFSSTLKDLEDPSNGRKETRSKGSTDRIDRSSPSRYA